MNPQTYDPNYGYGAYQPNPNANPGYGLPPPVSLYSSEGGIPVNPQGGVVQVESRTIFIRNLPLDITHYLLGRFLDQANTASTRVGVDLKTKRGGGLNTFATATYASEADAMRAVQDLNGKTYGNQTISVRLAKEQIAV